MGISSGKTILSGIQPSNGLHLGNLLGAVKNWTALQDEHHCYYMMVDLHAITVNQSPEELRDACYRGVAAYLAAGLDPGKSALFLQSHVGAHSQLAWLMICSAYMGELSRMTQFKDKSARQAQNIPAGLFVYPALMAADILIYQADLVPVGSDQKQHIELTRNLAERLNQRYSHPLFRVPEPFIAETGCRVMDLQEPLNKMSKSAVSEKGTIFLGDSDRQIIKKFKSAVTDSGSELGDYESASPGVRNLIDLLAALTQRSHQDVMNEFSGRQYGFLKLAAAEAAVAVIAPIRTRIDELMEDRAYLDQVLQQGAMKASAVAEKTLRNVMDTFGFVPPAQAGI
ncbi:MAG: tryptophan--tRNA ligase [Deltaproteobacteria bacterium]|nr:tryptophan--tRNA ligase [Deltaproteobacteria bacterium]